MRELFQEGRKQSQMACEDAREKLLVGVWDVGMAETGDAKSRVNFKKELMKQGFCGLWQYSVAT